MKKLLLCLGTLTTVIVPTIAIVSCTTLGDINKTTDKRLYRTFEGVKQKWVFTTTECNACDYWWRNVGKNAWGYWEDVNNAFN